MNEPLIALLFFFFLIPAEGFMLAGPGSFLHPSCLSWGRVYSGLMAVFLLPSWLFEGLGRDKAEELLQLPDTKIGSFMIRESETKRGEQPPIHLSVHGSDMQALLRADSFTTWLSFPPPMRHANHSGAVSFRQPTHHQCVQHRSRGAVTWGWGGRRWCRL